MGPNPELGRQNDTQKIKAKKFHVFVLQDVLFGVPEANSVGYLGSPS